MFEKFVLMRMIWFVCLTLMKKIWSGVECLIIEALTYTTNCMNLTEAPKEVVKRLLHLFPSLGKQSVSKQENKKRTPLWYAVRYDAPDGVVGLLLEIDPSVVLAEDRHSENALALVWDNWAEKLEGRNTLKQFLHPDGSKQPPSSADLIRSLHRQSGLYKRWLKVNMFLKAAFGFPVTDEDDELGEEFLSEHNDEKKDATQEVTTKEERKWRILHATSAVKCHHTLFLMACALHPEQASELDENDLFGSNEHHFSYASAQYKTSRQTALHLAASSNATGEAGRTVITSLLKLFPEAAQLPDAVHGSLPLHRIVENPHKQHWTFDGISPLYMMYPHAVQCRDNIGRLPLHRAAASIVQEEDNEDVTTRSIICNLLEVYPEAASMADTEGCMPLHLIATNAEFWDDKVNAIWEAYHPAATRRTGPGLHNSLPIHLVAANMKARRSLIEHFVEMNPRGASQPNRDGLLPLHLACQCGKDWEEDGVEAIYNAFPQAVRMAEEYPRRWMALHMAVASEHSNGQLIDKLVELFIDATGAEDNMRRQPLHLACIAGKSWAGGVKTLFESNPGAISVADIDGFLPFHLAALQSADKERETNTPSIKLKEESDDGVGEAPKDIDDRKATDAAPIDILFNLLRADPTTILSLSSDD